MNNTKRNKKQLRITIFDNFPIDTDNNVFCRLKDLTNESSVENFFVNRLLKDLGYEDKQIKNKKSISEVAISLGGRKTVKYKPDYVLMDKNIPRCVLEAKATDESVDDGLPQCRGYCLTINQKYERKNPVELFLITNGLITKVYKWDQENPLLELLFSDFQIGHPKYEKLRSILSADGIKKGGSPYLSEMEDFEFQRPTQELAKQIFLNCHKTIWKSEGMNPTAAFMEFTKLMFVKLWADLELRQDPKIKKILEKDDSIKLQKELITFSTRWIKSNEKVDTNPNPVNDVLFINLRNKLEKEIVFRKKKRIFNKDEIINLSPDTIKSVVKKLEHYDMFGIDEDLNGRLFETFLSATMRGRELGQYFTPRSIVKLMTKMSGIKVERGHIDKVIDACCGTGGFLIEALTDMREKVRTNQSLSKSEKMDLLTQIANESIYGIDFGKEPPIARIARINMYLHGDGGSRIYYADALDKHFSPINYIDAEVLENQNEIKQALHEGLDFEVALTNPPFSMTKELSNEAESKILKQYELARYNKDTSKYRPSLRSSAMLIERYRDLLAPRGRLFTIIDDTLLSSDEFKFVRDFIRENFIIRAIVSLPGDAFRRSGARVKTSILCLEKKSDKSDLQTPVFVAFSEYLGVDDLTPRASVEDVKEARKKAEHEIAKISSDFHDFLNGAIGALTVPPERIRNRLDLKYIVPLQGRLVKEWVKFGIDIKKIGDVVEPIENEMSPMEFPNEDFTLIKVAYSGICQISKKQKGRYIKPQKMLQVHDGDIIFSKIRAIDGAIGIVPFEFDGALVSKSSYFILKSSDKIDTYYLWSILRSYEIRADLMSPSTGTGRYVIGWDDVKNVQIPWLDRRDREEIAKSFISAEKLAKKIKTLQEKAHSEIAKLGVVSEDSKKRLKAYMPPK